MHEWLKSEMFRNVADLQSTINEKKLNMPNRSRWMSKSMSMSFVLSFRIGSNSMRTYHSNNKQILTQEP